MRDYVWTKGSTPPEVRILRRLEKEWGPLDPAKCWIWPGAQCGRGGCKYGAVVTGSRSDGTRCNRMTHVVMFEAAFGEVPDGLELDHLCRTTLCCNPAHLEAVTHQVNMDRKPPELVEKQVRSMLSARGVAW